MYTSTVLATAVALATTVLAGTPGSAIIVNGCTYPVYLAAVPAAGGGYTESDHTLQPKDTWTQPWTQLSNGNGWSLKLSKTQQLGNILQYEYTYHNDGRIWFDLSAVDGNPWNGNWEVTSASKGCTPKQSFYRYSDDDAFGMQDCTDDSSVTVLLCSAESQADSVVSQVEAGASAASPVTSVVATTSQAQAQAPVQQPTTTEAAPTTTATHADAPAQTGEGLHYDNGQFGNKIVVSQPTTFATSRTAAVMDFNGNIVTEVVTVVETAIAYETYTPGKRHVHHPEHPHFR